MLGCLKSYSPFMLLSSKQLLERGKFFKILFSAYFAFTWRYCCSFTFFFCLLFERFMQLPPWFKVWWLRARLFLLELLNEESIAHNYSSSYLLLMVARSIGFICNKSDFCLHYFSEISSYWFFALFISDDMSFD
jgi:hypothetical protein